VANQIATDIELFFNWGAASALGAVLLATTLLCIELARRLLGAAFVADAREAP